MFKGHRFSDKLYLSYLRLNIKHLGSRKLQRLITRYFFNNNIHLVSDYGAVFLLNTTDYIDQMIVRNGDYEPQSIKLCYKILSNGGVFVDVGANFGLYSLNLWTIANLRIIAIEPNPVMLVKLLNNIKVNFSNTIEVISAAVGQNADLVGFYCPSMNNSGNNQVSLNKNESQIYSPQIRLDMLFDKLGINQIDLIKIDVEGYEKFVLDGIDFKRVKPKNILLEVIPEQLRNFSSSADDIRSFLEIEGYSCSDIFGNVISSFDSIPEDNILFTLSERID